ncbi:hypothetical protein J7E83_16790 [Arthrobacter sp. ISL-48]|nr:hypothetical protein [Arthrobacter sp. ISL-48]MBT2533751.1 hypothetical protein [Arthrobacter sp. ISL-48]
MDEDALSGRQPQPGGDRPVRGLQHLWKRADDIPSQVRVERDHVRCVDDGVLGVAAVDGSAETTHQGGDFLPASEVDADADGVHDTDGFDAQDPGQGEVGTGFTLAARHLGLVDPKRHHVNTHPSRAHFWDRDVTGDEAVDVDGAREPDCAHRLRHGSAPFRGMGDP